MPKVTFVQPDGSEQTVHAEVGQSVMQVAVDNHIHGILGDCGGSCSCATCHGYVDERWADQVPPAASYEVDMLSCAMDVNDSSRLTCQISMTPRLDGLIIRLPASQT